MADVGEDIQRIGLQGFAGDQFVSLYRYYRKLTTPAGQSVTYSDSEISVLQSMRVGVFVNPASLVFSAARTAALRSELALDKGLPSLTGSGLSVIPQGAPLIVTGHSLGGHLALLFGRFFPDVADQVFTYNAPGIGPQGELALRWLGIPPIQPSRVTNLSAAMGNELVSRIWSKPGENIGIFTEPGSRLHEHSIIPLADSLALYDAFSVLSPRLTTGEAEIGRILAAASPYPEDSLEVTLDALRSALGDGELPTLIAREASDLTARDNYYQNLYQMLDGREAGLDYRIASLAGKSAAELASMAASDVSVRYALHELNAFTVKSADYAGFADSFSGAWMASRAEWLAAELDGNLVDRHFGLSGTPDDILFRDMDSGLLYSKLDGIQGSAAIQISALSDRGRLQQFLGGVAYNRTVIFGSESPDDGESIAGLSGGDRLFGGAGGDHLDGGDGDDYLEGGAGDDTLIGGAGDDTLVGGEGTDRLEGGSGNDAYRFSALLDADTIVDRDGMIFAGATLLTGGAGQEGGRYLSGDGQFSYEFDGNPSVGGTLVVNGSLRIEGFHDGDLGIHLANGFERQAAAIPATETEFLGDFIYLGADEFGNPVNPAAPSPDRDDLDEEFPGTPGNTHFVMGGGHDLVQDYLGGDDCIELGRGDDAGFGGSGNDVLEGGTGRDLLAGGRGDDVLYAGSVDTLETDLDDSAIAARVDGGDLLAGGDGDDRIFGDAEVNLIDGGAGSDQIFGGAGDDWIGGDVGILAGFYGVNNPNNDAVNRIVDLLWSHSSPPGFSVQASGGFGAPSTVRIGGISISSDFATSFVGDADRIDAGAGNDTVFAGGGDDLVYGGIGNDYIHAGAGDDTVIAGAGDDYIDSGDGKDAIYGGDGQDNVVAIWDALGDYIDAGAGDDFVSSGIGDDILVGGPGNDRLFSFGGNDILIGGDGDDFLAGFDGGDLLDGGAGNDTYTASAPPDRMVRIRMGRGYGADLLEVRNGSVAIEVTGDVSPSEVTIAPAERKISARDGDGGEFETLTGIELSIGSGADTLFLVDSPADVPAPLSIEFADGTVWDDGYLKSLLVPPGTPPERVDVEGTEADDWLFGGEGDNTYRYAFGDGFDEIQDADAAPGNTDALELAGGIAPSDIGVFATGQDYILSIGDGGLRLRGGRTAEGAIERIEFADGTRWGPADLEDRAAVLPENRAPQMTASLGKVSVDPGGSMSFRVPQGAAGDPDRFDSLTYYALAADGDKLPGWLQFDAATLTITGTPAAPDSGNHDVLVVAVDRSGAAAVSTLTVEVTGDGAPAAEVPAEVPAQPPAEVPVRTASEASTHTADPAAPAGIDAPPGPSASQPLPRRIEAADAAPAIRQNSQLPQMGVSLDLHVGDMPRLFQPLLQIGRINLGERYADAVREFEERRQSREEAPLAPPPTDVEVEAWNSAMHSWHARNSGFSEADLGGDGGSWTMGWGLPGTGDRSLGGAASAGSLELANPNATSRLNGAGATPALKEGLWNLG
ncbi:MAG TPA: putative Ig domain-containing protein [Burkholderiales bacterium]|nr:putative Ig domain-containing protein [Burkholderiales bacterium]